MEFLLGMLKWSAVVGAAALILTLLKPLLDRRYSAKWRYGAWLAMAAFLLLAPARWESLLPRAQAEPPVVIEVPRVEVSFSPQEGVSFQRPAASPVLPARPGGAEAPARAKAFPLEKLLLAVWLDGMALFFGWYLVGTWRLIRRAKRWSLPPEASTAAFYESLWREMGLKKAPPLRFSRAVDSPMAAGLFRPCLLLPGEPVEARELAFILRHELTHYRRRDLWYKLLLLAANGMHWFNPLAWLLRREAERDLELTCDDAVVAGRDDEERRAYSEALLSSIHRQKGLSRAALSTHFYGGKEVMMERFRNILGNRGRKWGGLVLAIALLATVAAACALGVKPSEDGELAPEELAAWQEKVESRSMDRYICRMYTDVSCLPPEEVLDELSTPGMIVLGHEDVNPKVVSGTKSGDTVTLELEGNFGSRLPSGTLTLVNEEPVSFTTPLYTAVETAARELMENAAEGFISNAKESAKELEFTEKYITNLFCSESMTFDGKTYYVWELYYVMKPNDIDNIVFAGDISVENGWLTTLVYPGTPILIFSVDEDGKIVLEEQTWSDTMGEEGYTWEEYVYCALHLGIEGMHRGIMSGWPELNTPFLESLRDGHDTWALDWQDVAISYLNEIYGIYADGGMDSLRTFKADETDNGHDQAVLAQAVCGDRTVTLLLAHVVYPVEAWDAAMSWWQVVSEKWEPDAPDTVQEPEAPDAAPEGALTEDELAAFTSYFNVVSHNSLLRVPYESFDDLRHYQEILLYDLGKPVTDETERAALEERMNSPIETDCLKLTREEIRTFYHNNFLWHISEEEMDRMLAEDLSLPNLPEYDAFYLVHGDTMMTQYAFDRGERSEDGTLVNLYYTTDLRQYSDEGELDILWDQPMCVSLWKSGNDGWRVVSNLPVD